MADAKRVEFVLFWMEEYWDEVLTAKDLAHDEMLDFAQDDSVMATMKLHELEGMVQRGELTESQMERYHTLEKVMVERAPILEEFLKG